MLRGLREDADVHDRPVVVLLDDTHCSDESDVRALTRTTLRGAGQPVIWCTTRRWGRPDSPLDIALGSLDLPHRLFRLRPLDEDAIRRMACDLLGAEPDEELARLVSSVSGHPQALRTLLEGLMDECGVDIDVNARLRTACLPEKFKGLVRLRLQDCSPSSTQLLLVASVLGTHLIFGELIEVLGQTASQLLPENYHLRKIFQALSIRSRTDLVRLVHTAVTGGPGPSHRAADTLTTAPTGPGTR
ncbi:hypothetical protein [Streptomyces sennicomposti]|uniref:hypothetical protein n=1 Tax=Streptomyces sennicomposti TaxID=2873384 RepID=UPI001CA6F5DA|nr:hypothetical protein [Streptomyces sennicomposti]MBY8865567.1 hypothetical protein [Streptomyces sennicomposti]